MELIYNEKINIDRGINNFNLYFPIIKVNNCFLINIKAIDDKLYLYMINKNVKTFINVFNYNGCEFMKKYITISNDNNIISIPDDNYVYFYKIYKLLDNELELCEINSRILLNGIPKIQKLNEKKIIDYNELFEPEKCYLYNNKFIIISKNKNGNFILINNFSNNLSKVIDYNNNIFCISENGNYILLLNENILYTFNVLGNEILNDKVITIKKELAKSITSKNISISDNGDYVCIYLINKLIILNVQENNKEEYLIKNFGEDVIIKIYDYNNYIFGINDLNKLNVILLWNPELNIFKFWILLKYKTNYLSSNEYNINNLTNNNINKFVICGRNFIELTEKYINITNIEKMIIINITNFIIKSLNYSFDDLEKKNDEIIIENKKHIIPKWMKTIQNINNQIILIDILKNELSDEQLYKIINKDIINNYIKILELTELYYIEFIFIKMLLCGKINENKLKNYIKILKNTRPFIIESIKLLFNINLINLI